ncbi:hypothetical protein [Ruegeria arenilitoris]|uniref:hypothetical protein n=1 Tax=Ruegeria arenilitoris TaxID=1173585 RepID=UPI00147EC61C|nr:hypothetical protein [Ruegeria arenilitoris]
MEKAVGFYWTLPVTWAHFVDLPSDVEEAAEVSRTIRYQKEMIRRYAKTHGYDLIREEIFMEIEPDRGSASIQDTLNAMEVECLEREATVLIVDFSRVKNWRRHGYMTDWFERTELTIEKLDPDPLITADWSFDPHKHFSEWRRRQLEWMHSKPKREAAALARARQLKSSDVSYAALAEALNAEHTPSPSGKRWSESNVRLFLKKHS